LPASDLILAIRALPVQNTLSVTSRTPPFSKALPDNPLRLREVPGVFAPPDLSKTAIWLVRAMNLVRPCEPVTQ